MSTTRQLDDDFCEFPVFSVSPGSAPITNEMVAAALEETELDSEPRFRDRVALGSPEEALRLLEEIDRRATICRQSKTPKVVTRAEKDFANLKLLRTTAENAMVAKPDSDHEAPEAVLQSYIDRLDPKVQELARSVRAAIRKRLPKANELAYDYKTFVVLSYSPTDRGIDGIVSIAARPDGVRLYLMRAPQLPDPKKLLQGKGKQARFVRLEAASDLAHPDIKALIDAAIDQAEIPLPSEGRGRLILRT